MRRAVGAARNPHVAEWCLDAMQPYDRPGAKEAGSYAERGGSFAFMAREARSARRSAGRIDDANDDRGLRPARAID